MVESSTEANMEHEQQKPKGLKSRINSFRYAFQGIRQLFRSEPNALIHLIATIIVIATGFYFDLSSAEWLWIVLAIALVFTAELFNSALEYLSDVVSPGYNEKIKHAKDLAAGAVLVTSIFAVVVAILIFYPKFC